MSAERLRTIMAADGVSRFDLAARSGLPGETIDRLLDGHVERLDPQAVAALAYALHVDASEFAAFTEYVPTGPRLRVADPADDPKRCPCGTVLAGSNPGRLCARCQSAETGFRTMGERGPLIQARARQAAYVWTTPERYATPADWGAELTKRMDALCDVLQVTPPDDLVGAWAELLEPFVGVVVVKGPAFPAVLDGVSVAGVESAQA